jgi:hypothetical protein
MSPFYLRSAPAESSYSQVVHKRFDPMPEPASAAALDMTLRPFVDRFVREDKRSRASALLDKHAWSDVFALLDTTRARTYTEQDLTPWHAVRGVFLVDKDAFSLDAKTAFGLYVPDPWLFIAYSATFAVTHEHNARSLLFT